MKNEYTPKIGDRIKWRQRTSSYSGVNLTGTILKISDAGFVTSSVDNDPAKKQTHRPSKYSTPRCCAGLPSKRNSWPRGSTRNRSE